MTSGIHDQMGLGFPQSTDLAPGRKGGGQASGYPAARRDPSLVMPRAEAPAPSRGPNSAISGQMRCQECGRRSLRVTAPPLCSSIATASIGPKEDFTEMAFLR